jgi:basic membrane protein A and related proteins
MRSILYRKNTLILIALVAAAGVIMGCGPAEEEAAEEAEPEYVVGMATDVGGLGDQSFNDGTWDGLQRAEEEFDIATRLIESNQQTDYIPNLAGLAEAGTDLVFAVGFLMQDAMMEAASNHPETYFAGIDIGIDPEEAPDNAVGIQWKEQQAGYLAGLVAGYMTREYADASEKLNDENVVGVVIGLDIPPVERYQAGYYAGVKEVNPDARVISATAGAFDDQSAGKEIALGMIDEGADIVFHVAGLTGLGIINAAKERGVFAIGVDVDQNHVAPGTVLTSAMKGISQASYLTIENLVEGDVEGGQNFVYGVADEAVDIAPFHEHSDMIPQEVKDRVAEAKEQIRNGELTIPQNREEAGM